MEHGAISVLLVDDQRLVGAALKRLLASEQDIDLHCCYNAVDAVAYANQINPTIILQDLVLPDIDGMTMVRLFRANPATADTPVIVLSGNDNADVRARALAEGANDYLVKLPAKTDLLACIRRHAGASGALSASDVTTAAMETPDASTGGTNETLDRRVLAGFRQATDGAADFTLTLIDQFITEAALHLDSMREARQRRDESALTATAHSLKGSSMTMGARRLGALCAQIEEQASRSPGGIVTLELMIEVDREFVNVQNALCQGSLEMSPALTR